MEDYGSAKDAPCIIEDNDGTSDGDGGKGIWLMGTLVDGGSGGFEMASSDAGRAGMPPYPCNPYRKGYDQDPGRPSSAVTRRDGSPCCCCMP
jgi:hypothetical protein